MRCIQATSSSWILSVFSMLTFFFLRLLCYIFRWATSLGTILSLLKVLLDPSHLLTTKFPESWIWFLMYTKENQWITVPGSLRCCENVLFCVLFCCCKNSRFSLPSHLEDPPRALPAQLEWTDCLVRSFGVILAGRRFPSCPVGSVPSHIPRPSQTALCLHPQLSCLA